MAETLLYTNAGDDVQTLSLTAGLRYTSSVGAPVAVDPDQPDEPTAMRAAAASMDNAVAVSDVTGVTLSRTQVDVAPGGTASVVLTVDPSSFAPGYYGGYVTATNQTGQAIQTPIGLATLPETFELTVAASDGDGAPFDSETGRMSVVNVASGATDDVSMDAGAGSISLPRGQYVVIGDAYHTDEIGRTRETVLLSPQVNLTGPAAVALDGKTARPVTVTTDKAAEGSINATVTYQDVAGNALYGQYFVGSSDVFSDYQLSVTPVAATEDGSWVMDAEASLSEPALEGALDPCGTAEAPVVYGDGALDDGAHAMRVVPATGTDSFAPAPDSHAAALVGWSAPAVMDDEGEPLASWIRSAADAAYETLLVDSAFPSQVSVDIGDAYFDAWLSGRPLPDIVILVTTHDVGDALRARASSGAEATLYLLARGAPSYVYQLAGDFSLSATVPYVLDGTPAGTSSVTVEHRSLGPLGYVADSFVSEGDYAPNDVDSPVPGSYVAYVSGNRAWKVKASYYQSADGDLVTTFDSAERTYTAATTATLALGDQVLAAGFNPANGPGVERDGDSMFVQTPWLVDGQGQYETFRNTYYGGTDSGAAGYADTSVTLSDVTTGAMLEDISQAQDAPSFAALGLSPDAHSYRLEETITSDPDLWPLSTSIASTWTWTSARREQQAPANLSAEPLRQVWYELPGLDAHNNGSARQSVILHVNQLPGSSDLAISSVVLQQSIDDGQTWDNIQLTASPTAPQGSAGVVGDETLYVGSANNPAGAYVSLRATVAGEGSSLDQTIRNAYRVTGSPAPFAKPLGWTCPVIPPPVVTGVVDGVLVGTAAPGATVAVTLPDGESLKTVASDDGVWRLAWPDPPLCGGLVAIASMDGVSSEPSQVFRLARCDDAKSEPGRPPIVSAGGPSAPTGGRLSASPGQAWLMATVLMAMSAAVSVCYHKKLRLSRH